MVMSTPKVLVIAGSDSSGGAGLEADQRVLAAHGCFAMTATTALTAQNTHGVQDVHVTPPAFVEKQIKCVLDDGFLDSECGGVVKIGMLASAETISTVAKVLLGEHDKKNKTSNGMKIVLDPVMVSTSGQQLLPGDAVRNLCEKFLPETYILTPNIPEALLLLREAHPEQETEFRSPTNLEDLKQLARKVHELGPSYVLLKGGHVPLTRAYEKAKEDGEKAFTVDIVYPGRGGDGEEEFEVVESPYLDSPNTHGTGCSLASAVAAQLALNSHRKLDATSLPSLVRNAVSYISHAIRLSTPPHFSVSHTGRHGPINHFHSHGLAAFPTSNALPTSTSSSSTSQPHPFTTYLVNHPTVRPIWARYTQTHPFTTQLAAGTLPPRVFKHYLIQDYLYLTHFARTYSLAGYKSRSMDAIVANAQIVQHIRHEMALHLSYCAEFGVSREQIERTRESVACQAYSRFILDVGAAGDLLGLYVALAPCLLGYGEVARRLWADTDETRSRRTGNRYWRWVENYVADDYIEALRKGKEVLEREAVRSGVAFGKGRLEELVAIFAEATRLEVGFWEEGAHIPEGELEGEDEG